MAPLQTPPDLDQSLAWKLIGILAAAVLGLLLYIYRSWENFKKWTREKFVKIDEALGMKVSTSDGDRVRRSVDDLAREFNQFRLEDAEHKEQLANSLALDRRELMTVVTNNHEKVHIMFREQTRELTALVQQIADRRAKARD